MPTFIATYNFYYCPSISCNFARVPSILVCLTSDVGLARLETIKRRNAVNTCCILDVVDSTNVKRVNSKSRSRFPTSVLLLMLSRMTVYELREQ